MNFGAQNMLYLYDKYWFLFVSKLMLIILNDCITSARKNFGKNIPPSPSPAAEVLKKKEI